MHSPTFELTEFHSPAPKHNLSTSLGVTTALRKDTVSFRGWRKWWNLLWRGMLCVLSSF
jgi:hypothetical protein